MPRHCFNAPHRGKVRSPRPVLSDYLVCSAPVTSQGSKRTSPPNRCHRPRRKPIRRPMILRGPAGAENPASGVCEKIRFGRFARLDDSGVQKRPKDRLDPFLREFAFTLGIAILVTGTDASMKGSVCRIGRKTLFEMLTNDP